MNSIEKMINELCPEGVKRVKLGEVCEIKRGVRVVKKDLSEDGMYAVYQNSLSPLGFLDKFNVDENTTFIIIGGAAGDIGFSNESFWAADDCLSIESNERANSRFIYHLLLQNQLYFKARVRKASVPRLSRNEVDNFQIPLPPLPIQEEIVRILDKCTDLIKNIDEEIALRQQQYEYYRNQLLGEKLDGVEWVKLGEIGSFFGGLSGKTKNDFVDGNCKFISYMNIFSNPSLNLNIEETVKIKEGENQTIVQHGDCLFTGSSETPEECGMSSVVTEKPAEPLYLNSFCFGLRLDEPDIFDLNFLKHLLRSYQVRKAISKTANGVTRFNVSKKLFAEVEIPIPPLPIQEDIVSKLDKFNDVIKNLEEERKLRQKQYEHYREQLLTF